MLTLATILGGGGPTLSVDGFYAIDFLVYVGILVFLLKKPTQAFLQSRRANLTKDIEEARKMREEAQARLKEYDARLGSLEEEIQGILDDARAAGEKERQRIMVEASKAAERMRLDAQERLAQETRKLQLELKQRMVDMSVDIAERIISEQISDTHRRNMVGDYIADLEQREGTL